MMPGSAQYKMDQLVSLMMAEDEIEPSEQFVTVLKTLDPAEVIIFVIYTQSSFEFFYIQSSFEYLTY